MSDEPIVRFHRVIDELTLPLETRHRERLQCRRGCSACCVDDISVYDVEAECIRQRHGELLRSGEPHEPGACAFLDEEGACRIYEDRPYVCRTQGLPLRWVAENHDGEVIEHRDICELNVVPERAVVDLDPNDCWSLGPAEIKLQQLEAAHEETPQMGDSGQLCRVRLRDLFAL